jgi:hypothetical protein
MQHILNRFRKTSVNTDVTNEDIAVLVESVETMQKTISVLQSENEKYKEELKERTKTEERRAVLSECQRSVEMLVKTGKILPHQRQSMLTALLNAGDGRNALIASLQSTPTKTAHLFRQTVRKSSAPPAGKTLHLKYKSVPRETMNLHERVQKYSREHKITYTEAYRLLTKVK